MPMRPTVKAVGASSVSVMAPRVISPSKVSPDSSTALRVHWVAPQEMV